MLKNDEDLKQSLLILSIFDKKEAEKRRKELSDFDNKTAAFLAAADKLAAKIKNNKQ